MGRASNSLIVGGTEAQHITGSSSVSIGKWLIIRWRWKDSDAQKKREVDKVGSMEG